MRHPARPEWRGTPRPAAPCAGSLHSADLDASGGLSPAASALSCATGGQRHRVAGVLPAHVAGRTGPDRRAPQPDDVDPERQPHQRADRDLGPPRQDRRRRHETLEQAGDAQHHDQAERDRDQRPALLGQGTTPWPAPGVDHGPEQLEARSHGHEHRSQLQQPVRQDELEEHAQAVVHRHDAADHAHVHRVLDQGVDRPHPGDAERDGRCGDERVVRPDLQREARAVVGDVVLGERLVGDPLQRPGRPDSGLRLGRVHEPDPDDHRDRDGRQPDRERPPADPVEGGGQGLDEEARHVGPRRVVGAGDRRARPGEQLRQVRDDGGVRRGRAHGRQLRRHLLVEAHQLVGLRPAQPAGPGELVQPLPARCRARRRTRRGPRPVACHSRPRRSGVLRHAVRRSSGRVDVRRDPHR